MPKVFVLVNPLNHISSFVYSNHIEFFIYSKTNIPGLEFRFFTPHRMSIDNARNQAAVFAMQEECDYLMFIDDDVLIPKDTLVKFLAADKDIIAGLVLIRGFPFNVMAFKWEDKNFTYYNDLPKNETGDLVELVTCAAIGFSCAMIRVDILKALEPPFFVTGRLNTEDVYFCLKCADTLTPIPEIFLHTGVRCGHLLNPEPIEWATKQKFQDLYKTDEPKDDARAEEYIKACMEAIGA